MIFDITNSFLPLSHLSSVFLESLYVGLETLDRLVSSSHVNGDTELSCFSDGPVGGLEFGWGEPTSGSDSDVVSLSWTSDSWAEIATYWSWGNGFCLENKANFGFFLTKYFGPFSI
jgi:hypothetical protein